jgi:hypothetical protein
MISKKITSKLPAGTFLSEISGLGGAPAGFLVGISNESPHPESETLVVSCLELEMY